MAENTAIEWCDHTFNPWQGCTKVSPGCDHCYAEARQDKRLHVVSWGAGQERKRTSPHNWRTPLAWNRKHAEFFALHGRRQRVFCASLADVFDNEVPRQWRQDLFDLILATPNLDWLLLTKRIGNARRMLEEIAVARGQLLTANDTYRPPENVWIGATIVNQAEADRDLHKLLDVPARVRFLSMEPLLGPVTIDRRLLEPVEGTSQHGQRFIDWIIVGGESGPGARPMHPDWPRSLRDQCAAAGARFLFKQWGEWKPICQGDNDWYDSLYAPRVKAREGEDQDALNDSYGRRCTVPELILRIEGDHAEIAQPLAFESGAKAVQAFKVGKKAAGRLLDSRTHDEFPEVTHG